MGAVRIIPVILCGGSGERLRPLSHPSRPKQFLRLTSDRSLLQETVLRAGRVSGAPFCDIVTVTLETFEAQIRSDYDAVHSDLADHILAEPAPRNTAAAIGRAALYVQRKFGGEAVLWVLPSDHFIQKEAALKESLRKALRLTHRHCLVTFGIRPSRPDIHYGYIKAGALMTGGDGLFVESFMEKPDEKTARAFIKSGSCFWNSGMFAFKAEDVLDAFRLHAPGILQALESSDSAPLPSVAFDRAILEKSTDIAVVPCDPGWSDIGSWEALWDIGVRRAG